MQSAREIVLKGLYRLEKDDAYSNKILRDILRDRELAERDRGFAAEIFMGVVRNQLRLDYIIQRFSKIRIKKLSLWVHLILRTGIYQIVFMDNIPDSAACNEAVKLAQRYANTGAKGYVNGVLRSVAREKDSISYPEDCMERLSVFYSCPLWLVKKLAEQYGTDECEKILEAGNKPSKASVRVNRLKTTAEELVKILAEEGIKAEKSPDNPVCLYIDGALNIEASKAYKDGLYTVQNTSSMAAAEALAPKPDETVLDMCAAPGGKTAYIAELMENRGEILAFDIHEHKTELIRKSAQRLGISIISVKTADAGEYREELEQRFDRVLADVPCSGIGVMHKKPDIKWKRREEDIESLCKIQRSILENAGRYVKKGGALVYSTCTILKEENQEQTKRFIASNPDFYLDSERLIFTHETGGSGFYIARFIRKDA